MPSQSKKYQTQWTSQFYVAAELTRRGYLVSLTLGNAPKADLLVVSPNEKTFKVDVKGQRNKSFWLIQNRESQDNLFFIFVYLSSNLEEQPTFYIMSCHDMLAEREKFKIEKSKRKKYRDELGGFNWSTTKKYQDKWESLPK